MSIIRRNISTVYGLAARLNGLDDELLKRGKFLGRLTLTEINDIFANATGFVPGSYWVSAETGDVTLTEGVTQAVHENDTIVITGFAMASTSDVVVISASLREQVNQIGDVTTLTTTEKGTVVGAVNELKSGLDTAAATIVDETTIDQKITNAQLALGTNYTVADLTERDALADLEIDDRVYVRDNGNGKWATYKPVTVDSETGAVTDWLMLMSQDIVENALTAEGIKTAYESNADTNAFDDSAKAKVDFLTVTQAIDLDTAVTQGKLVQDMTSLPAGEEANVVASAEAIKNYVGTSVATSSAMPFSEKVTVVGNSITLTHTPRGGIAGVMNFSTVRWIDENGVSWDAPVVGTADPKVFDVVADADLEWDTNEVQIQYLYQPA